MRVSSNGQIPYLLFNLPIFNKKNQVIDFRHFENRNFYENKALGRKVKFIINF